ncbi:MAG TPA: HTH domain-containing protein [Saprospiraceae bacterium]|nr:HTH domain-containing protein [Saprospiraceae bacterium]
MKLIENAGLVDRVICLIKRKATGDASEFAEKLNISKRSVQRLIQEMKEEGYPIVYCKSSNSYVLTEAVTYEFRVTVGNQDLLKIKGGRRASEDLIGFENL